VSEFVPPGTRWHTLTSPFPMKRGGELTQARLAYETWGELAPARDNAVLILTGLSPTAHVASHAANPDPGWWEGMVGPGKPIDTRRWFVICVNSLGSCKGSTGPASRNPDTGRPYRLDFPPLSIEDGAHAAHELVAGLGIDRLACVIGCSMGGMTALALLAMYPGAARAHVNVSGAACALPFSIAIRSLQREAIRLDPMWNAGDYGDEQWPEAGMRIARKLGVVTYRSSLEWDGRFGRVRLDGDGRDDDPFGFEFQVESYLEGHARRFIRQFDPNCYLYLSRSMDWFDLTEHGDDGGTQGAFERMGLAHALTLGVTTDILFPLQQQQEIAEGLLAAGVDSQFAPLDSHQGHDAFLVDLGRFGPIIAGFMTRL
jgi:homoserine O-acetyltransferase/O-succinyltransferase